jgi:hygromycin-B 7''-O-kinase
MLSLERPMALMPPEDALPAGIDAWLPVLERLLPPLGATEAPIRCTDGSLPVFLAGEVALKLYPSRWAEEQRSERAVLERLAGRLPLPTPVPLAAGQLEGWAWLAMSRLQGQSMRAAWPQLGGPDRRRLCAEVGALVAALREVPTDGLQLHTGGWEDFERAQVAGLRARQASLGLEPAWLGQLEPFVQAHRDPDPRRVLLHTELMQEHVFVEEGPGGWRLSGLLDFEPAAIGAPNYELASVGVYLVEGEAGLWPAFVEGLGERPCTELSRRALCWTLLHRYSHLARYLTRLRPRSRRLEELAEEWWG